MTDNTSNIHVVAEEDMDGVWMFCLEKAEQEGQLLSGDSTMYT